MFKNTQKCKEKLNTFLSH